MNFELIIQPELLERLILNGIRINGTCTEALWAAVNAAEAAQDLGEGIEPDADEGTSGEVVRPPYAIVRTWEIGDSPYEITNRLRRENRKIFGRRARFTIYPDGLVKSPNGIAGNFVLEVRYPKNSLFQPPQET